MGALLSPDGRYVAFSSWATDLTPAGTEAFEQSLFLFDRTAGTSRLVDVSLSHEALIFANAEAFSADGRFLAFTSNGQHLVPGQTPGTTNSSQDVFLSDVTTGALTLVSRSAASAQTTGDSESITASLSADRPLYPVLQPGDQPRPRADGLQPRVRRRLPLRPGDRRHQPGEPRAGARRRRPPAPPSSSGGRSARTAATPSSPARGADLAANAIGNTFGGNLYLYDRATGANTLLLTVPQPGKLANAVLSADGRIVAVLGKGAVLPGQTGPTDSFQLFLYDRVARTLTLASRAGGSATTGLAGGASDPALSADGR